MTDTAQETLRLYAFDLIVFSGQNLSSTGTNSSLLKRYGVSYNLLHW